MAFNTANSQISINIPREGSVISFINSYLELNFDVVKKVDKFRNSNGYDVTLVILSPIAIFSNYKLMISSAEQLEDVSHVHVVFLMYKLITSKKDSDDFSFVFDQDSRRRQQELKKSKHIR